MPRIKSLLLMSFGTLCLVFAPAYAQNPVEAPPAPAVEYDPRSWKEFVDQRAMFSIMFPGTPVESDNSADNVAGRKFTLATTAVYFVGYQDFSSSSAIAEFEKNAELRKQLFDRLREGARQGMEKLAKVKLLEEADISINGYPGRSQKFSMENGNVMRQHVCLAEKRLYQIFIITPKELLAPDGGQFDQTRATKFLTSFKLVTGSAQAFFDSCFARYKEKDWDRAITDCSKAIELGPPTRDLYILRGIMFRDAKGNFAGAIADFDKAIKLDPNFGEAYRSRGWAKYKQNDLDGAIADQSIVIEKEQSARSYHERGLLRLANGDLDNAIDDLNVSIEKSPELTASYELRAKAKFLKKDFAGSIADFVMVIKLDPTSSNAHLGRGLALLSIGKDKEAQQDFDKFLELAPDKKAELEASIADVKRQRRVN